MDLCGSFFGALVISLVLVPLVRRLAIKRDVLDSPGAHKSHHTPVPYLGGVAMVVAFSLAVVAAAVAKQDLSFSGGLVTFNRGLVLSRGSSTLGELFLILGLALGLSVMGLIDDLRGSIHSSDLVSKYLSQVQLLRTEFSSRLRCRMG